MAVRFSRPRQTPPGPSLLAEVPQCGPPPGVELVNWRAVRRAGRACCCPAAPAVIAVMPPSPGRPHRTEILLCRHHYRAHRAALEQAGAAAVDLDGAPAAPA